MSNILENVIGKLENVRPSGSNRYTAQCPNHDDRRNSLSVCLSDDGRALLKCFAGCDTSDVIRAMGLQWNDLFPKKTHGPRLSKGVFPR